MANSIDSDQKPQKTASDLGLHCLLKPDCPNTYGKYSIDLGDELNKQYAFVQILMNIVCMYDYVVISMK